MNEILSCIECGSQYQTNELRYKCDCGGLLEVKHSGDIPGKGRFVFRIDSQRRHERSGVWRFGECVANIPSDKIVTLEEGNTRLYEHARLSSYSGIHNFHLKHEGQNPTASFKDRGMTVAVSKANELGKTKIACASTGNTSAALAAYAGAAGLEAIVFVPEGKIAMGKLSQAIGYGAKIIQIDGDFDAAMRVVQEATTEMGLYLVNSLNPFRLEGQKTIVWEMLAQLNWNPPDWIVVPAGNLGNTSAFGKALREAQEWGWIKKIPKVASVQAAGANPFFKSFEKDFKNLKPVQADTIASAIRIGNPVNFHKAKRVIEFSEGVVTEIDDNKIMEAKALIDEIGIGCEPASACALAGTKKLKEDGVIKESDSVVGVLTGHILKDSDVILKNAGDVIFKCQASLDAIKKVIN